MSMRNVSMAIACLCLLLTANKRHKQNKFVTISTLWQLSTPAVGINSLGQVTDNKIYS